MPVAPASQARTHDARARRPARDKTGNKAPFGRISIGSACTGLGTCFEACDALCAANLGLQMDHVFACERWARARQWLGAARPGLQVLQDVTDLASAPRVDVFISGFPCQPFSSANRKRKADDPRREVLPALVDYIVARRPQLVLLENVPGVLSQGRSMLAREFGRMEDVGYQVGAKVLDSSLIGRVPQSRRRVYFVARLSPGGPSPDWRSLWPAPLPCPPLQAILDNNPCDCSCQPSGKGARAKVQKVAASLAAGGLAEGDSRLQDVLVGCLDISGHASQGRTPCLTSTRGQGGGWWLLAQRRMFSIAEMQRLQGMDPAKMDLSSMSRAQAGRMLGNAFTQSVFTRLLAKALPFAGLAGQLADPVG